jgi:hypothetical protein
VAGLILLRRSKAFAPSVSLDDWDARSSDGFVIAAAALNSTSNILAHADDLNPYGWTYDTASPPPGTSGCARVEVTNALTDGNGNVLLDAGQTFGPGDEWYYQYALWVPPQMVYQPFPTTGGRRGWKTSIFDRTNQTNSAQEIVSQGQADRLVFGYNVDVGLPDPDPEYRIWTANRSTEFSGTRAVHQNMIDNGSGLLIGNDPDTGAAWSNLKKDGRRYGGLLDLDNITNGFAPGVGFPTSGGYPWPVSEWFWLTCRVQLGDWDVANTIITWAISSVGRPQPVVLSHRTDACLGDAGGHNRLWGTFYHSDRVSGGVRMTGRSGELAAAITPRAWGLGCPAGDYDVSWNASTGQLTVTPPSGGTTGDPRGVSSTKRFVNLFDDNDNNNYDDGVYAGLEVTDYSALPGSNTTETFTIARDRRDDTYARIAQMLMTQGGPPRWPGAYTLSWP